MAPAEAEKKDEEVVDNKVEETETNAVDDSKETSVAPDSVVSAEEMETENDPVADIAPTVKGVRPPFKFNIAGELPSLYSFTI